MLFVYWLITVTLQTSHTGFPAHCTAVEETSRKEAVISIITKTVSISVNRDAALAAIAITSTTDKGILDDQVISPQR